MIFVVLSCGICGGHAGTGLDLAHADFNLTESGGRIIADLRVCRTCARPTR